MRPPGQRLTRREALRAYTLEFGVAGLDDERRVDRGGQAGRPGVLDAPYLKVPGVAISEIKSVLTLLGGEAVYDPRGWVSD